MRTSDKECEKEGLDQAVLAVHALAHSHSSMSFEEHVCDQMHISLQMKRLHGFWHCSVDSAKVKPTLPPDAELVQIADERDGPV